MRERPAMPTKEKSQSTCAVRLTPLGRGAVATVLVAGPRAIDCTATLFSPRSGRALELEDPGTIRFGRWGESPGEEVVVAALGPALVEVHCHGGTAAPQAVLDSLVALGCELVDWQTWLEATDTQLVRAEALTALAAARTERTAAILLDQYQGAIERAAGEIEAHLVAENAASAATLLAELLARARLGRHLTEPFSVVLAGPPNVGKSSLINALVGYQRTIVHDAPGTTRDIVTAPASFAGWPVELADTAGLRLTGDALEAAGVELAETRLSSADAIVLVFDIRQAWDEQARQLTTRWPAAVVVYNKSDLASPASDGRPAGICTSAVVGRGLDELERAIEKRLVLVEPLAGEAVPFTPRQVQCLQLVSAAIARSDTAAALVLLGQLVSRGGC
jgi:tRNA modification GTPase